MKSPSTPCPNNLRKNRSHIHNASTAYRLKPPTKWNLKQRDKPPFNVKYPWNHRKKAKIANPLCGKNLTHGNLTSNALTAQNQPITTKITKPWVTYLAVAMQLTRWDKKSMGARAERMRFQELRTYTFPDCFNSVNDKSQFLWQVIWPPIYTNDWAGTIGEQIINVQSKE